MAQNRKTATTPAAGSTGRLAWLVNQHGQSEVARKTGAPVANVHRYLKGARMPAEFCGALVKGLGVNPAWLLTGEGTPYLADVTSSNAAMAGDLLALVEAMNAVSQMRLGSLTGKQHLQVLHELNDAMRRHEELRARLDGKTRPVFKQIVDDLAAALRARKFDQAAAIIKAGEQVSRLCGDESLQLDFSHLQSHYEYYAENVERSIRMDRVNLTRRMAKDKADPFEVAVAGHSLAMSMRTYGMVHEARRICRAAIGLYGDAKASKQTDMDWRLHSLIAMLELDLGNLVEAWRALNEVIPVMGSMLRGIHSILLVRLHLYLGISTPVEALTLGSANAGKFRALLRFACWHEDPDMLRRVIREGVGAARPPQAAPGEWDAVQAQGLLEAFEKPGKKAAEEIPERLGRARLEGQHPKVRAFSVAVFRTQIARISGLTAVARQALAEAERVRGMIPDEITPTIELQATHARNGMVLLENRADGKAQYQRSLEFFKRLDAAGFDCFEPMIAGKSKE
ncbi:MAG: helix-turn-helix transcriptional regulator [Planctomycetes bacterium]|nr:helix-turn-helix transcriptional regulator [Planctomycetota bacterium]